MHFNKKKKQGSVLSVTHIIFVALLGRNCKTRLLTSLAWINTIRCAVTSIHNDLLTIARGCNLEATLTWI